MQKPFKRKYADNKTVFFVTKEKRVFTGIVIEAAKYTTNVVYALMVVGYKEAFYAREENIFPTYDAAKASISDEKPQTVEEQTREHIRRLQFAVNVLIKRALLNPTGIDEESGWINAIAAHQRCHELEGALAFYNQMQQGSFPRPESGIGSFPAREEKIGE